MVLIFILDLFIYCLQKINRKYVENTKHAVNIENLSPSKALKRTVAQAIIRTTNHNKLIPPPAIGLIICRKLRPAFRLASDTERYSHRFVEHPYQATALSIIHSPRPTLWRHVWLGQLACYDLGETHQGYRCLSVTDWPCCHSSLHCRY